MDSNNQYGTKERQTELLEMMKDLHILLFKHNIQYCLNGGSLLGAIRHNGFIPWDDDIDIMADRTNYRKIVALFNRPQKVGNNEYIMCKDFWINKIHKQQGNTLSDATIDIFVIDNCPDSIFQRKVKLFIISFLQGAMHKKLSFVSFSTKDKLCLTGSYIIGLLLPYKVKWYLYDRISQWGNKKKTVFVSGYNDIHKYISLLYPSDLLDSIYLHTFEDTLFPITKQYDRYLTTVYGDYMTPPESDQRKPMHIQKSHF